LAIAMGVATAATSVTGAALGILTAVLGPVAIALGVVAAAVGVGVLAYKGYQKATEDSITSVDRFATNNKLAQDEYQKALASSDAATKKYMKQQTGEISSSTKKVLGDYFKLSDGIRQKLTEIKLNHEVMTTEQAQKLGQQYDQLTEKIITKVDERKQKETERLRKLFADSYVLTSEEENKRLELLNQKYEDEKIKVAEKNQKIKEINDLAASEHREKTHSENVAIQALQDEMDRIAVQHMTQNQMEQKVILENMRVQASEISARQAAEVVENSAKTRDKVIKDAEKTRNDKIAEAIRQRDEIGSLNAQEAEAVIAEAKRQYDSTVSTARDKHKEIVS
ncbi:phage tail tape measure protein, partial [Bacillus cereus]|nr:phage tail tape measure protein [Bacillus cereus]